MAVVSKTTAEIPTVDVLAPKKSNHEWLTSALSSQAMDAAHEASIGAGTVQICITKAIFECDCGFRLRDLKPPDEDIELRNNLILASIQLDAQFVKSDQPNSIIGPGDGSLVYQRWRLDHNWRELTTPPEDTARRQGWIPPSKEDVLQEKIQGVTRQRNDLINFLRPANDGELAQGGAGRVDPSLPVYVGALPPSGVQEWDWSHTHLAPPGQD